ncbi:MAG: ATP-binding protein [Paludibacteraceae bacterium]|nr:ATP-binding protein [Paludibacteraceae bacterium]
MEIKVDKKLINQQQYSLLLDFEKSLKGRILELVNSEEYKHLSLKYGCAIVKDRGKRFLLSHNASFGLSDSYSLVSKIEDFLRDNANLEIVSPEFTILIDVFMEELKSSKKDNVSRKDEDTSIAFEPVDPKYCFDQIILPDKVRCEILEAIKLIEVKDLVFNDWGFGEVEPVAKSVLNMYGPPGTGKTMCAHAIANRLGKKLLALNYSEIESKYLGEAAKNLKKAFETATLTDSVVFFDEADSFLGKRVENVTSSSDQALNSLRSQMLILLEEHQGVVLFATNLVTNFDSAFNSRIQKHIMFELPNKDARADIISKKLPPRLPLEHSLTMEDFLLASESAEGLSGREIKNAIFEMLLSKADVNNDSVQFSANDVVAAMKKKRLSLQQLEDERKRNIKERILKRVEEKIEEDSAIAKYESDKKGDKSDREVNKLEETLRTDFEEMNKRYSECERYQRCEAGKVGFENNDEQKEQQQKLLDGFNKSVDAFNKSFNNWREAITIVNKEGR